MKKLVMLLISLLVLTSSYAPIPAKPLTFVKDLNEALEYKQDEEILDYNLVALKDGARKTREEVYHLVQPIIDIYLKRKGWKVIFPNLEDSVSHVMACIFVSESSNSKGRSGESSLWMIHNNPFGLTARQGVTKKSWELINHKRVVMNITFRTFDSFEEAIESLIWDYLLKKRFDLAIHSSSVKEFLYNLYQCGYMTNYGWPKFAYNEIYLKAIKKHIKKEHNY